MEAEERVGVEVVEGGPRTVPVVGEFRVGAIAGHGKFFPLGDIHFRDVLEYCQHVIKFWMLEG